MINKSYVFIRISDGTIFTQHPRIDNRWVHKEMFDKHNQEGWEHWTTELFTNYVIEGSFDVAFIEEAKKLSEFYKKQNEYKKDIIKKQEKETGECYYCFFPLHNCTCSHDD